MDDFLFEVFVFQQVLQILPENTQTHTQRSKHWDTQHHSCRLQQFSVSHKDLFLEQKHEPGLQDTPNDIQCSLIMMLYVYLIIKLMTHINCR